MRTHLAKSLQKRSKTIRKAVTAYNGAAAKLTPPRQPLDWATVAQYGFLEEFNLLQDTRNDIRDKRWTQPAVRETMKLRHRIARAREELVRCDVELRRLHTAIRDENILFNSKVHALQAARDPVYGAVAEFTEYRRRVNQRLLHRIHEAYDLPGFTANKTPGTRLGSTPLNAPPLAPITTRSHGRSNIVLPVDSAQTSAPSRQEVDPTVIPLPAPLNAETQAGAPDRQEVDQAVVPPSHPSNTGAQSASDTSVGDVRDDVSDQDSDDGEEGEDEVMDEVATVMDYVMR